MTDMGNQNFGSFNPANGQQPQATSTPREIAQTVAAAGTAAPKPSSAPEDSARMPIGVVLEIAGGFRDRA
jgi:hypothetical protein